MKARPIHTTHIDTIPSTIEASTPNRVLTDIRGESIDVSDVTTNTIGFADPAESNDGS